MLLGDPLLSLLKFGSIQCGSSEPQQYNTFTNKFLSTYMSPSAQHSTCSIVYTTSYQPSNLFISYCGAPGIQLCGMGCTRYVPLCCCSHAGVASGIEMAEGSLLTTTGCEGRVLVDIKDGGGSLSITGSAFTCMGRDGVDSGA